MPTLALLGVLWVVGNDSRQGKADARLAAGFETATAIYSQQVSAGTSEARRLSADPGLASAVTSGNRAAIQDFAQSAIRPGVAGVEILDRGGNELAVAGRRDAVAFGDIQLARAGEPAGTLRASTTTAPDFAAEVHRLTGRELVVSRNGEPVAATVTPPNASLEDGQTADLKLAQGEFRGHVQTLDPADDESLLLLGPPKEGGFLAAGRSAVLLLVGFLLLALLAAYILARILTRLHGTIEEQALTDSLTGLQNRRRFREQLSWETDRALRFGHSLSLLILDVDDFKAINDLRGHPQGDAVLRSVADAIRASTRSIDFGARYGGDELVLMLIETEAGGAAALADRLCTRVRDSEVPVRGGGTMRVTVSIGVATLPDSAGDAEALIDAADKALLQAKRSGKDQIRTASVLRFEPTGTP